MDGKNASKYTSVNVESLEKGIYLIKVKQGVKQSVWKIVKD
jgi:hypothetical protein